MVAKLYHLILRICHPKHVNIVAFMIQKASSNVFPKAATNGSVTTKEIPAKEVTSYCI